MIGLRTALASTRSGFDRVRDRIPAARPAGRGHRSTMAAQSAKAALAGILAWLVAGWWLDSPLAVIAPWVAIVTVQTTVYRSVRDGLWQLGAMAIGTVVATGVHVFVPNTLAAMCLVLPATLALTLWRRVGDQGVYSATTALFVLVYGTVSFGAVVDRLREAAIGAVIGVVVNAVILPPVYHRRGLEATQAVSWEAGEILRSIADGLRSGVDRDAVLRWDERGRELTRMADRARTLSGWSAESRRWNPRYEPVRRQSAGPDPEEVAGVVSRVVGSVNGLVRVLLEGTDEAFRSQLPGPESAGPYADLCDRLAQACQTYSDHVAGRCTDEDRAGYAEALSVAGSLSAELQADLDARSAADPSALGMFLLEVKRLLIGLPSAEEICPSARGRLEAEPTGSLDA
ncbi:Aromatic acid exporter family member 1 [Actinopolymorpha singaporensis]|uniref:Aromatic acid exporter family member 1 n=2 Tax=Actinopolymorpha singaporensis TaxID=117157 RepID=A0A1H1WLE8_9ACTN|nr:Aromatic acid exporter family member 1 [Actinopolymorpha singaporensis]